MTAPFLSLDLEFNQPSGRIIQVGVTLGSRSQPEEAWVVKQWLLDPLEPISEFISKLTGITDSDISARAVPWEQMAQELSALLDEHKPFVNPVTWGGGDSQALLDGLRERNIDFPHFGRRWLDVKTMHSFLVFASGHSKPSGGLSSVMARYKLHFVGTPHRADADALNTLRLFFHLLERQSTLESLVQIAKGVSK